MSVTRLARVVTPERDEKQYRRCRLSNGLEVLLISDATLCGADDDGAGAGASEDDGSASEGGVGDGSRRRHGWGGARRVMTIPTTAAARAAAE